MTANLKFKNNTPLYPPLIRGELKGGILHSQKGMALVLTLIVLALVTAMVTEFAHGVYTGTNSLYNWYDSQRLSVLSESGVNLAKVFVSDVLGSQDYTYPGSFEMDFQDVSKGFDAKITLRVEDENSKFNINSIIYSNGRLNEKAYNSFKRLLSNLSLDKNIADYIADWIDPDSEERTNESEGWAKNAELYSIDELMLIKGIDRDSYERLLPYVTVYGDGLININGAEKPVLMSLSDEISDELAQRIIDYRGTSPFEETSQLQKVTGFNLSIYGPVSSRITVKGKYFYIKSSALSDGIKSIIEAVIGTGRDIKYWREI
jgi:general secretion pathway protein K